MYAERDPENHFNNFNDFVSLILFGRHGEFHFYLLILACFPTRNLNFPTRTVEHFMFIPVHISSTCISLTAAGAMPVTELLCRLMPIQIVAVRRRI